ncbi:unnamed protein product, partial [Musa hybrid cultivar]
PARPLGASRVQQRPVRHLHISHVCWSPPLHRSSENTTDRQANEQTGDGRVLFRRSRRHLGATAAAGRGGKLSRRHWLPPLPSQCLLQPLSALLLFRPPRFPPGSALPERAGCCVRIDAGAVALPCPVEQSRRNPGLALLPRCR